MILNVMQSDSEESTLRINLLPKITTPIMAAEMDMSKTASVASYLTMPPVSN